ncbi:MAG: zinc-ribbon domain-containing protein [Oscillospiraceae bacterium]
MYDYLMGAINGTLLANFLILLIGAIIAVAVGIVLHVFVFGPKNNAANPGKVAEYANGKRFLPLTVIKVAYYSIAIYLVFMGIAQFVLNGYNGLNGFIQYSILGNVVLRIAYECVLAVRKTAGIDTDNDTAEEPKVTKPLIPSQPQYQQPVQTQYQQPVQTQYQSYQQPAPAPVPAPMPAPAPAPAPMPAPAPVPMPAPAPAPIPEPVSAPAPIPEPVPAPAPIPEPVSAPAPIPEPVPAPVELAKPQAVPAPVPTENVQPAAPASVFCGSCGKQIKADAKFCPFCGTPRQ